MAIQYIKIEPLTPVYIGGAEEKNWQKNIDVFQENGKLYYVPDDKIAPYISDKELQFIINGDTEGYNEALKRKKVNFEELALYTWDCPNKISQNEIKAFIRNGNGSPFIPGSSVKGAITSHLFKLLHQGKSIRTSDVEDTSEKQLKNIAGFLQCTDSYFAEDATAVVPTKIFNLQKGERPGVFAGGWKHKNNTNNDFNTRFVTVYEVLSANTSGYGRIKLVDDENYTFRGKTVREREKKLKFWNGSESVTELFQLINKQTGEHLKKEHAFYEKYEAEYNEKLIESIASLQEQVHSADLQTAVLRIGGGSGFHSITGDYRHDSYEINNIFKKRGQLNREKSAKSRKVVFEHDEGGYQFSPLGFIKLTAITAKEYQEGINGFEERKAQRQAEIEQRQEKVAQQRKEQHLQEEAAREAARKAALEPEWKDFNALKQGDIIDAEVLRSEGMRVVVKLFIRNYKLEHDFRFPAGKEKGKMIKVDIKNFEGKGDNKKIQAIGYKGDK